MRGFHLSRAVPRWWRLLLPRGRPPRPGRWHVTNTPPVAIRLGDCIEVMRTLLENSVDAIVTDPPYGLGFMGKAWDELPPGEEWARECLRVLKPGGHLLAFGGSRTWHRLAVAVEDAGFEVRDSIAWLYGSGFPKSLDVSKAIDKAANSAPLWDEIRSHIRLWRDRAGMTNGELNAALGLRTTGCGMAAHWTRTGPNQQAIPSKEMWQRLKAVLAWPDCHLDATYDAVKDGADRPVVGVKPNALSGWSADGNSRFVDRDITAPATDDARKWAGFGTALKPAFEPIVVARKPLVGTVAANVLTHGTGALNIDGCRVGNDTITSSGWTGMDARRHEHGTRPSDYGGGARVPSTHTGRWPANVVLDESQAAALDQMSGVSKSPSGPVKQGGRRINGGRYNDSAAGELREGEGVGYGDSGGASRFFPTFKYQAKASASERIKVDGVAHPTVKPLALMRWLVRLVTPPGGTVLEPFAGSGTTVEACALEGFACIAIEREPDYLPLIQARLARVEAAQPEPAGPSLFDVEATA